MREVLRRDNFWLIESAPDRFVTELGDTDIPLDSNVMLYHGDLDNQSTVWDVYRTHKQLPIRSRQEKYFLCSSFSQIQNI